MKTGESRERVVIGYVRESGGADVLRLGAELAGLLGAQPIVVTAVPSAPGLVRPERLDAERVDRLRKDLAAARETLADLDPSTSLHEAPTAAEALQDFAAETDARMIVLGSCGRGGAGRTLPANVATSLFNGAPCAVAIAPYGYASGPRAPTRIAVGFSGTPESWAALETGAALANKAQGELTILSVADYPAAGDTREWPEGTIESVRAADRTDRQYLLEIATSRVASVVPVRDELLEGDAGELLSKASSRFDLLVAGSRSWGPLGRTVLGSATRTVVASSSCPVLIHPRGGSPVGR